MQKVKSLFLPTWLDAEVRLLIKQRDAFKKAGRYDDYKMVRNKLTNLIKKKKKRLNIARLISTSPIANLYGICSLKEVLSFLAFWACLS